MDCSEHQNVLEGMIDQILNENNLPLDELMIIKTHSTKLNEYNLIKRRKNKLVLTEINCIKLNKINNTMERYIEDSLKKYIFLFKILKEDNPHVRKIEEYLLDAGKSFNQVKKFWEKNPEINGLNMNSKLLYCLFIKNIMHQEKKAEKIAKNYFWKIKEKSRDQMDLKNFDLRNLSDFSTNSEPVCFLERTHLGIFVKNCNMQFCALIKKEKSEIIGKETGSFLNVFSWKMLNNLCSQRGQVFNKKKLVIDLMDSCEYLVKILVCDIKVFDTIGIESYCLLKINIQKYEKPRTHLIIDKRGDILRFDAGCYFFFGIEEIEDAENTLDLKLKIDFHNLVEKDYLRVVQEFDDLSIRVLDCHVEKLEHSNFFILELAVHDWKFGLHQAMTVDLAADMKEQLEFIKEKEKRLNSWYYNNNKGCSFVFKLDKRIDHYIGDFRGNETEDNFKRNIFLKAFLKKLKKEKIFRTMATKKFYGDGIRIKRLQGNMLMDVNEFEEDTDEIDLKETNESTLTFQKKKSLNKKIIKNQKKIKKSEESKIEYIEKLKQFKPKTTSTYIFFIIFLALSATFHTLFPITKSIIEREQLNQVKNMLQLVRHLGIRNDAATNLYQRFHDITITNQGVNLTENYDKTITKQAFLQENIEYFRKYSKDLRDSEDIILTCLRNFPDKEAVQELNSNKIYELLYEGGSEKVTFEDCVNSLYSNLNQILTLSPEEIKLDKTEARFFWRNFMYPYLQRFPPLNVIRYSTRDRLKLDLIEKKKITINSALVVVFISLLVFLFLIHSMYQRIEKAVALLYNFEKKYIIKLLRKTHSLLNITQESYSSQGVIDYFFEEKNLKNSFENFDEDNFFGRKKTRKKRGKIKPWITCYEIIFLALNVGFSLMTVWKENRFIETAQKGITLSDSFSTIGSSTAAVHLFEALVEFSVYNKTSLMHKIPNSVFSKIFLNQAILDSDKFFKVNFFF